MKTCEIFKNYPELEAIRSEIDSAVNMLVDCYRAGGKVLICGNGGSAADSEHIAGELLKGFLLRRPLTSEEKNAFSGIEGGEKIACTLQRGIGAIPLPSISGVCTAYANDCDPELVFAQEVFALAKENDVLIGLTTSGNSKNVVAAIKTAKAIGIRSIAMTGEKDSESSKYATLTLRAPSCETYRVQEYHLPIYHYFCAEVERILFCDGE